jgi:hypothetical protein
LPFRPKPASRTSSFSSTKLRQPSFGTAFIVISLHPRCPSFNPFHHLALPIIAVWNCRSYIPKAVTFFPFLINCTLTHFRIAELGCLASTPTFSRTMPLA